MRTIAEVSRNTTWYLEGYDTVAQGLLRVPVRPLPFRVGRSQELELSLRAASVSQAHAEIFQQGDGLTLRDTNSTNGTFLNHKRVTDPVPLQDGDILHFADQEFRLVLAVDSEGMAESGTIALSRVDLPRRLAGSSRELRALIDERAILPLFQPIVEMGGNEAVAFEALCRGTSQSLPTTPADLLILASSVGMERELSRVFRAQAVEEAKQLPTQLAAATRHHEPVRVFFNTHAAELADPRVLITTLEPLAEAIAPRRPVLEIHETAVTDLAAMRSLVEDLERIGMELAYDDFGAGQARLMELVEARPTYLKFDIRMIRDLDQASEGRIDMISSLVALVKRLGVIPLAEGVERPAEARVAREVGFELAQGFLYGRPGPAR